MLISNSDRTAGGAGQQAEGLLVQITSCNLGHPTPLGVAKKRGCLLFVSCLYGTIRNSTASTAPIVRCRSTVTPPISVACCSWSAPGLVAQRMLKLLRDFCGFQFQRVSVAFSGFQWVSVGCGGLGWVAVVGCGGLVGYVGLWWIVVGGFSPADPR